MYTLQKIPNKLSCSLNLWSQPIPFQLHGSHTLPHSFRLSFNLVLCFNGLSSNIYTILILSYVYNSILLVELLILFGLIWACIVYFIQKYVCVLCKTEGGVEKVNKYLYVCVTGTQKYLHCMMVNDRDA